MPCFSIKLFELRIISIGQTLRVSDYCRVHSFIAGSGAAKLEFKYFSCGDSKRRFFLSSWGYHIRGEVDHLAEDSCEAGTKTKMLGFRTSQGLLRTAGEEANLFRGHCRAGGGLGTLPGAPGVHRE